MERTSGLRIRRSNWSWSVIQPISPIFSIVQSQCLQHMHSSAAGMTSNCLQEHHSSNDGIIGLNDLLSAGRFSTSSVDSGLNALGLSQIYFLAPFLQSYVIQ